MIASLLIRGIVAGLIAGVASGAFALLVSEPTIDRAIAIEERQAAVEAARDPATAAAREAEGPALVGRGGQRAGLVVATSLYGMALGGLFALAFAGVRGRVGHSDSSTSLRLAAALFVAVALVPFLKYPANPPAVGNPATITSRTVLYVLVVAVALLALLAAWRVWARLSGRPGLQGGASAAVFVATVAVAFAVMPGFDEVPPGFPATLLWDFRVASLGTQLVLWATLGVVFGLLLGFGRETHRRTRSGRAGRGRGSYYP